MMKKPTNQSQQRSSNLPSSLAKSRAQPPPDEDDYNDDFERESPAKNQPPSAQKGKNSTLPSQSANIQTREEAIKKKISKEEIQASNETNRFIIHKFMKKGFTSLTAEDLACVMVNPDFTVDFRKNTGEDWNKNYQYKMLERMNKCKFNLKWALRTTSDDAFEPFFAMVKQGDIGRVVEYLRASPNINEVLDAVERSSKKTALHIAAGEGHFEMCEFLLRKGARVDSRDKMLRTPIHLSCQAGNSTVTRLLMENNSDPWEKDSSGRTALHYACCASSSEQLVILTEGGPDLVHVKDHNGRTPLHYCIFNSHPKQVEMVQQLLNLGADVNALDNERRTPLHHAAEAGKARVIPILCQRGASTGTKDTLKGKTPMELAANDHIKELIIVNSTPSYIPKQEDLIRNLQIEGNQMKIEREQFDQFGMSQKSAKPQPPINKKSKAVHYEEDSKISYQEPVQSAAEMTFKSPIGPPPKHWEQVQSQYIPYNLRNYQERLVEFLQRVQEFGVQQYQHVKKPYMFTGSWMEHVRNLDDLMLQVNGVKSNEAVMKIFNILFPYDKPLPKGRGDELSLQGFYTEKSEQWDPVQEIKDCHPDVLREKLAQEQNKEEQNVLKSNQVEDIQDLLDIKRQLMALEQVNNMHLVTIQEKDERIKQLLAEMGSLSVSMNEKKYGVTVDEQELANLKSQNMELKKQVQILTDQLEQQFKKIEEFNAYLSNEEERKQKQINDLKSLSQLQELQIKYSDIEKKLQREQEQNRAQRFKAGQVFLQALEKGAADSGLVVAARKKGAGDYFLEDDDAVMRLFERIESLKGTGLHQRLMDAGEPQNGVISKLQFTNFLSSIGSTPGDITSLQRVAGYDGSPTAQKLQVSEVMLRFKERSMKRGQVERETLETLANDLKSKNYSLEDAFAHLDADNSGEITFKELQNAFKAMKVEVSLPTLRNLIKLFDHDGNNKVSLAEFSEQMSKYLEKKGTQSQIPPKEQVSSKQLQEEVKKEVILEASKVQDPPKTAPAKFEDFGLRPLEAQKVKDQEAMLSEMIKKGQIPKELISGELKIQFRTANNFPEIQGKNIPYISMTITNFNDEGVKVPKKQTLTACERLIGATGDLNKATRVSFPNKDKNMFSDAILFQFYLSDSPDALNEQTAEYVGEIYVPWKDAVTKPTDIQELKIALSDPMGKCKKKVQGMVQVYTKWIPMGSEESNFDVNGQKKEGIIKKKDDQFKKQNEGVGGKLEAFVLKYHHPEPLPESAEYYCEGTLGGQTARQPGKKSDDGKFINYQKIITLGINNVAEVKDLTLRFKTKEGQEVSYAEFDLSKLGYEKFLTIEKQPMKIQGKDIVGSLFLKLRIMPNKEASAKLPASLSSTQPKGPKEEEKKEATLPKKIEVPVVQKEEEKNQPPVSQQPKPQQQPATTQQTKPQDKTGPAQQPKPQAQPIPIQQPKPEAQQVPTKPAQPAPQRQETKTEDQEFTIGTANVQPAEGGFEESNDFE